MKLYLLNRSEAEAMTKKERILKIQDVFAKWWLRMGRETWKDKEDVQRYIRCDGAFSPPIDHGKTICSLRPAVKLKKGCLLKLPVGPHGGFVLGKLDGKPVEWNICIVPDTLLMDGAIPLTVPFAHGKDYESSNICCSLFVEERDHFSFTEEEKSYMFDAPEGLALLSKRVVHMSILKDYLSGLGIGCEDGISGILSELTERDKELIEYDLLGSLRMRRKD